MKTIGFQNFRKFKNFPELSFAPITILVGGNNAGKSTVVKGLLAFCDFLKTLPFGELDFPRSSKEISKEQIEKASKQKKKFLLNQKFYFNTNPLAHIGTFERALNNTCNEDVITFKSSVGVHDISVEAVKGKENELPYGLITHVDIFDNAFNISMKFDLHSDKAEINMLPSAKDVEEYEIGAQKEYFSILKSACSFSYHISDYWTPEAPNLLYSLLATFNTAVAYTLTIPYLKEEEKEDFIYRNREFVNPKVVQGIHDEALKALTAIAIRGIPQRHLRNMDVMYSLNFRLPTTRLAFNTRFDYNIEYIYSHAVNQNIWYLAGATDYLSKTIHEFAPEQNVKHKHDFITKWMDKEHFGIGQEFWIESVGGEAFRIKIQDFDGSVTDLADKGMGTIQLMVLLFRLAITLPKKQRKYMAMKDARQQIIIVEEPEQNIHPKLQSLLADLFAEMSYLGFRFIVETHSEYLVRKTQVIVKKLAEKTGSLVENPFKVYYFRSEDNLIEGEEEDYKKCPYKEMIYQEDGFFYNDFDAGFYDQSAVLTRQIL